MGPDRLCKTPHTQSPPVDVRTLLPLRMESELLVGLRESNRESTFVFHLYTALMESMPRISCQDSFILITFTTCTLCLHHHFFTLFLCLYLFSENMKGTCISMLHASGKKILSRSEHFHISKCVVSLKTVLAKGA